MDIQTLPGKSRKWGAQDRLFFIAHFSKGLWTCGGVSWFISNKQRDWFYWLDQIQETGCTACCELQILPKPNAGFYKIEVKEKFATVPKRFTEMFSLNALAACNVRELIFTLEELRNPENLHQLGHCFARMVRGDATMPAGVFDTESFKSFPDNAWTEKARTLYAKIPQRGSRK